MNKKFWINVPVGDMARAKAFYAAVGFRENGRHAGNPAIGSFFIDA